MNPPEAVICLRCHHPIDGMAVFSEGKDYRCLSCYQKWVGQGPIVKEKAEKADGLRACCGRESVSGCPCREGMTLRSC